MIEQLSPAKHRWPRESEKRLHGTSFKDGNSRTERTCPLCGLARLTVHGGDGRSVWREWRHRNGEIFVTSATPPCLGEGASA
jgi:hypothetical protein